MKQLVIVLLGFMLIAPFAQATTLSADNGEDNLSFNKFESRSPLSITQNVDPYAMDTYPPRCLDLDSEFTLHNWFLRRFVLAEHGSPPMVDVQSVDFAIWECSTDGFSIDLVLFTIATGDDFIFANMTEIARETISVGVSDSGSYINVPILGTVDSGYDLVVAIEAPDGNPTGTVFLPGGSRGGWVFREGYLACIGTGEEPMTNSEIAGPIFEPHQLIFIVNGDTSNVPTATMTFSNVKSLY